MALGSPTTEPEVSVIVPVRDGAGTLPALLASIEAQTLSRERFELIVVDNASTDATAAIAAEHGAVVVREPVANRAGARNAGTAAARSRLFAFTDADCVAAPGWLEALLAGSGGAPLLAGEVRLKVGWRPNRVERFEALWRFGQAGWVQREGWAATANLLVRADAFEAVGGFDTSWRHIGEDADFCLRARAAGYALGFCADAVVHHSAERSLGPFLRRCFLHGYSANQAHYRLGVGHRAWREPLAALAGDAALRRLGHAPERFDRREWRRMAAVARLGHGARVAGSVWAELVRAR
jgi:glycosyltransferase involved in cell wall biosynthesis